MSKKSKRPVRKRSKSQNYRKAEIQGVVRPLVRVHQEGESSWAEHVKDDVYRSLNQTFSNVLVNLPKDHEFAHKNGKTAALGWGHLFRARKESANVVIPIEIIGDDMTPRFEGSTDKQDGMA